MDYIDISTNPVALRNIASAVKNYCAIQNDIISNYFHQMSSMENQIDTVSYRMKLEAIGEWCKRMEELAVNGDSFAEFLNQKADFLEHLQQS